jgi:hypothetical protein
MKCNIGKVDRLLRALVAAVLLILGYMYSGSIGAWQFVLYILAIIMLFTVVTRYCPPYTWLGINTCKTEKKK